MNYTIKIGQKIIDSDQIHVVSKIENNKIYYFPLKSKAGSSSFIPLENFSKACIRPLLSKEEIKKLLAQIPKELPLEFPKLTNQTNTTNLLKEVLYLNDPIQTSRLLIYLNLRQKEADLSRFEKLIYNQALEHLSSEISVANNTTIIQAQKQILSAIKR